MPEKKKSEEVKEEKTIDLDTSGPGAEVTLPEEAIKETEAQEVEVKEEKPEEIKVEEVKEEEKKEPEKELEEYGEGVKKRISKLTKRMREAERQKEAALTYSRSVLTEQRDLKSRLAKLDGGYVKEMEDRITSSTTAAQSKLQSAREANDIKAEVLAQKEIAKLGYEEAKLADLKTNREEIQKVEKERVTLKEGMTVPAGSTPTPDAQATEWAQENAWFGKDNAMTYTAFDIHRKLVEEEGYDPQSKDYYAELDRKIKLEFPHKFDSNTEQTTKPVQQVASANRAGYKSGRRTVKLTSSQVAIAKKLNVPLEEYAKQLDIVKESI